MTENDKIMAVEIRDEYGLVFKVISHEYNTLDDFIEAVAIRIKTLAKG